MTSLIMICNMALDHLNIENIASMEEKTKQAEKCKQHYDIVRKSLLTNLNASFSIDSARLPEILDCIPIRGYKKAYALPYNCLQVLSLGNPLMDNEYRVAGNKFYCEDYGKTVDIEYIKDVDDVTEYDAEFIELFALALAEAICIPLTEDANKKQFITAQKDKKYVECSTKYGRDNRIIVINKPKYRNARFCPEIANSNYSRR